ncbi:hypothetical protein M0Q39_05720 [Patescibacteria group bacterium]|nr:hypothetical protein [Patescibacteria group bacterium]
MEKDIIKRKRFEKLATNRTNEVLKRLKILGNCSNKNLYSYTEEDIRKIFNEIEKSIKEQKSKFLHTRKNQEFKL